MNIEVFISLGRILVFDSTKSTWGFRCGWSNAALLIRALREAADLYVNSDFEALVKKSRKTLCHFYEKFRISRPGAKKKTSFRHLSIVICLLRSLNQRTKKIKSRSFPIVSRHANGQESRTFFMKKAWTCRCTVYCLVSSLSFIWRQFGH